jgi:Transposase and inactivated derivatives
MPRKKTTQAIVQDIKRKTRRKYSSEEKIRIVLEGLRGETTIAELCRREGISPNVYYTWSKEFMEAGKHRLEGNTLREANTSEVQQLKKENSQLKELVAEISLENKIIKKSIDGLERELEG